ncbi:MAG: D-2-hydroxyacid dehydrogenase [Acidimicrobiales bacterium]
MGVRYLSTLSFSAEWLERLSAAVPGVDVVQRPTAEVAEIDAATWAEVEVLHTGSAVPDPTLAPRLRWVQLDTAGVDHLAGHPIWDAPVAVTTIGGVSPVPMAEYVTMMVLAFSHHLRELLAGQARQEWPTPSERWRRYLPRPVPGSTMGIVGYGRIGTEVGRLARALGMEVIGVTRSGVAAPADGVEVAGVEVAGVDALPEVAARCDWLVVVVPLTDETRGLVGAHVLGRLPAGSVVIDVARGGVVDEKALLAGLDEGHLGGAALDVFAEEPLPAGHPLWSHPRVVVTPHVSGFAPDYERAILELVSDNLRRFLHGAPLRNRVDRESGY